MNTLNPNLTTKEDSGVDLLRKSSKYFLIASQLIGIAGAFFGVIEISSWGFLVLVSAILVFISGYLVRGAALCLATITENSAKKPKTE